MAALGPAFGCDTARAAGRPNILLILTDDMGYSDVSPYGSEIFTPNIARLAAQGMMLSNFHVAAYCAPTRGMLLTGVDNHVVGLGNMIVLAEQKAGVALCFAEDAVVLDRGRAVFRGKSAELQADEALQHRLLAVGGR